MPRFSVIVPVYNSYRYLPQCVESVLTQDYRDLELILVDDGSTDGRTPALLDDLETSDPRVRVVRQENGGTSAARNAGMARAEGDYVTFMDNDDWWTSPGALGSVAAVVDAHDPDVVMHMPRVYREDEGRFVPQADKALAAKVNGRPRAEALHAVVAAGAMQRAVWTKVVRRSLIEDNALLFPVGKRNEDTEWTAGLIACARSYGWTDESFYAYRKGTGTAQTSKPVTAPMVDGLGEIAACYGEVYRGIGDVDPAYGEACESYLAYPLMVWMGQAASLGILRNGDLYGRLKGLAPDILRPDVDPGAHLAAASYRVLGFGPTCRLLGMAYRVTSRRG